LLNPLSDLQVPMDLAQRRSAFNGEWIATSICSIYNSLVALGNQPNTRCILKTVDVISFPHVKVKYLPFQYTDNSIFELPAIVATKNGAASRLDEMD
jgi:hypothetical protein